MEVIDLDELFGHSNPSLKNKKNQFNSSGAYTKGYNNKKNNIIFEIISLFAAVFIVLCISFFVVTFIGQRTQVNGSSMEKTLFDGDNLIIDKMSYNFTKPKRFDIIVFPHKVNGKEIFYIKRVIGLPGETVQISDGVIYIDNEPLDENFGLETISEAKQAASPILLSDDEYFVLGDNRNHSSDSREIGAINREDIVGRAAFRIWPVKNFGKLK